MIATESFADLVLSWPHWAFEALTDIVLAGVVAAPIRKWWQRHHEQEH